MQSYPNEIWDELKEVTILDLMRALEKDDFREDDHEGATRIYIKRDPVTLVVSINCSNVSEKCGRKMLKGYRRYWLVG